MLVKFKKPSGVVLEVNESSFDAAIALGWEPVKDQIEPEKEPEVPQETKRRGRPPLTSMPPSESRGECTEIFMGWIPCVNRHRRVFPAPTT